MPIPGQHLRINGTTVAMNPEVIGEDHWLVRRFSRDSLFDLLEATRRDGCTGALTIHYSQGTISSIEWRERAKS